MTEEPESIEAKPLCRNCGKKMAKKGGFCPHCGQKNTEGLEPFGKLLGRFWKSATHLDNKFVKMCWQLFLPARVTLAWAAGKVRQYPHPVQFFFVVMFFFLLLLSRLVGSMQLSSVNTAGQMTVGMKTSKTYKGREIDIAEALQRHVQAQELKAAFDSFPALAHNEGAKAALDSAIRQTNGPIEGMIAELTEASQKADSLGAKIDLLDTIPFTFGTHQVFIATKDIVNLSADQIIEKYQLTGWLDRLLVRQGIKSIQDPVAVIRHYVGSLAWTVLAHVALMAFFMSGLYWFQKRYYVEHFVFLLHRHSGNFLLCVLLLLLDWAVDLSALTILVWLAYVVFSLPFALKRYYGQAWTWTLLKWFIIECIGVLTFSVAFTAGFLLSFALF